MTDKIREEFEAWWMGGSYGMRKYDRFSEIGLSEDDAFEIWQASRESLVIELPWVHEAMMGLEFYSPDEVVKAIEAAGVKVKK